MNINIDLELGWKVKDKISGFTGIVTGICVYITGCHQVLVNHEDLDKDGCVAKGQWFDIQRLKRVGKSHVILENEKTPGFCEEAPTK